jgi:hypothetical protein
MTYLAGTLMVLSSSDGGIRSTTSVATEGLALGAGVPTGDGAGDISTRFLIEATNGEAPARLVEFDVATSQARVVPLAVDGASMVYGGLAWLGQPTGRAGGSIALQIRGDESVPDGFLPGSRVVAIDLDTHEQRTLYKGTRDVEMCRAVAVEGRPTDDVMISEVCEQVLPHERVWLELRRVSSRTGEVLATSTFPFGDGLMASSFGAAIDAVDDMDGDGTRDYVCSVACTCPREFWRAMFVSGATGALLGSIDDAVLARHLGPDGPCSIAPYTTVPLLITPGSAPAIGIGCGEQPFESVPSVAVFELSECLSAR